VRGRTAVIVSADRAKQIRNSNGDDDCNGDFRGALPLALQSWSTVKSRDVVARMVDGVLEDPPPNPPFGYGVGVSPFSIRGEYLLHRPAMNVQLSGHILNGRRINQLIMLSSCRQEIC
jgi:hypothetical protein